ncbi:unnamed protein product [Amoebophrya sp. A25]|nr:unnamed protein product [Amoebophrya sp. A25]|eukprot:GSA25T00010493001.1
MTAEQIDVVHFRGKQPEHEMAILRHLDCLNFLGGPAFMDHDSSNSTPQQVRVAAFLSRSGLACAEFFAQQEKFSDCFGVLHLLLSSPQFGTHHGLSAYASDSLLAICDVYYQFGSVSLQDDVFRELIDSATACFDPTTSSNLVTPSSVAASGKSRPAAVLLRRIVNMLNLFCRFSENPYACDVFASVRKLVAQIEHPYDSYLEDSFAESVSPADEEFLFGEASPVAAARGQKQTSPGFAKAAAESSSGVADHLHGTRKKRDEMKRKVHIAPEKAVNAGIWGRGARVLGPFAVRQWEKADPKTGGSLQIRNNPMAVCPRPEYESAAAMLRTLLLEDVPLGRCLLGDDSAVGKCGLAMVLLVCSFFRDPTSRRWLAPLATVSLMCLVKGGIELRDVAVGMSSPAKDDKNTKSAAGGKSVYGDSTSTRSSAFVAGGGSTSSFSGKDGSSSLFKGKDGSSISLKAAGRLVFHGRSYEDSATVNSTVGVGNSNGSEFLHLVRLTFKMLHSAQNTYLEMCSLFQEVTRTHKDLVLKYPYALVSLLIGTDAPASMEEGRRAILSQAFFDRQLYPELFEAEGTTLLLDNAIDNIRKQETEDLLDQVLNQSAQQEAASSTVGENNNPSGSGTSARRRAENLVVEQKTFLNYRSFTHLLLTAVLRIDCDFSRTFKREYQLGGSSSTANSVGGSPSTSTSVDAAVDIGQEISRRVAAIVMRSVCTWFGGECGPDSWYQALFVAVESGALSTQDADVILPGWSDHCNVITQRSSSTRSSPADVVSVVLPVKLYSLRELRLSASPAALFSLEFSNSRVFSSANPGSPEMQQPNHILSLALSSLKHLRVFDQRLPAGLNFLHSSLPYFCLKLFGAAFFQDASREKFLTDLSRQQLDEKKRAKPCRRYTHLFHPLVLPKFLVSHFFDSVRLQPGSFSQVGPDIFNPLWKFWTFDKRQDNAWISTAISAAADRDYVLGRLHPQDKDNIELFGKIADAVADEGVSSSGAAEAEMSTPSGAASTTTTMISVSDSAALAVDAAFLKQGQNLSSLLQRVPLLESETLMIDELKTLLRHGFECASPLLGSSESRSSSALVVMPDRSSAGFNDTRVLPALQEFGTRGSSVLGSAMYHLANVSLDVALSQGQSVRAWQVVLESYLQLYCAALDRTAAYESVDKSQSFVRKNCPDLFVRTQQEEDDSKKRKITVMPKAKAKAGAPPASGGGSAVASSSAEDQGGSQMLVLNNSEVRKLSVIGTTEKHAAYTKEDDLRELLFRQCLGVSSWLVADALRACRTEVTKLRKGQQLLRGGPALLKQSARRWLLSCADVLSVLLLDSSVVPKRRSVLLTHVFVHRMLHFLLQCSDAAALLPGVVSYFRQESSGAELRGPAAIGTASGGLRNKYSAPFVQILMEVKPEVRKQAGVDILLELEGKSGVPGELLWFLPFALARHLERFETGLPARDRKATITALCQDAFAMAKRCGADGQLESLYRLRKFQIKSCVNPSERKTLYDKFLQGFEQIVVAADAQQRGEGMQSAARRSDLEEQRRKSANGEGTEGANNNGNSANANYAKKARLYCARACFSIVRDFMRSIVGQGRDDFHENLQEEAYSWMRKGIAFLESVAEALPLQDLDLLLGDQKQDSYFGNCAMNPADQQWREHIPFSFLYEDAGEQLSSSGSSGGIASNKASTSTSSGALSSTTFDGTTSQKSCSRHDPWALLLEKRRYSLETEVYVRGCGTMLMCLSRAAQTQTLNPKTRPEKCNLPKTQFQSDVPLPALRVAIQKSTFKPILKMIQATVQLHTVFENVRGGDEARMAQTVMEQHTRCLLAKMVVPRVAEFFTPSWHVCHTLYIVSRYCGFCAREFEDALYHFILAEFCGCVPEANKRFMTTNAAACFPGLKPQEWVRERLADIKVAVSPFKFNLQRSQATHAAFTT